MKKTGNRAKHRTAIHPIAAATIQFSDHLAKTEPIPITVAFKLSDISPIRCPRDADEPERNNTIQVWREDTFNCARKLLIKNIVNKDKVAVLNFASDFMAAGGFLKGSVAQEETLARRSNLHLSLTNGSFYPIKADTILYTPAITVFREDQSQDYAFLKNKDQFTVNIISAAAIRHPKLNHDGTDYAMKHDEHLMQQKVRAVLRIAHHNNNRMIVLGAWGCGAFGHSPEASSKVFKNILEEPEFVNVFDMIVFAIMDSGATNNCAVFRAVFPIL